MSGRDRGSGGHRDGSVADGAMANMLRARVTDAFGNALAGQTVSVLADNGATVCPDGHHGPDGTVEISVTSQTAGRTSQPVRRRGGHRQHQQQQPEPERLTFIADVRTAQIADLVVIWRITGRSLRWHHADGAAGSANRTLRGADRDLGDGHAANGNALAGQTVSVMADNGATVAPTVITEPDGTVEIQCHQPDGG